VRHGIQRHLAAARRRFISLQFCRKRVRRFGRFRKAGLSFAWEEHPYEWVEARRMGVLREYSEGPFRWLVSVVELGPRAGGARVPALFRLKQMTGLTYANLPARVSTGIGDLSFAYHTTAYLAAAALVLLTAGALAASALATRRPPPALDRFAVAVTALTVHELGNPLAGRVFGSALVWILIAYNVNRFFTNTVPDIAHARRHLSGTVGYVVRDMLGISIAKELVEMELFVLALCLVLGLYVRFGVSSTFHLLAPWRELLAIRRFW